MNEDGTDIEPSSVDSTSKQFLQKMLFTQAKYPEGHHYTEKYFILGNTLVTSDSICYIMLFLYTIISIIIIILVLFFFFSSKLYLSLYVCM